MKSSEVEEQPDSTLVSDIGQAGVSPGEYSDPDYTTYDDFGAEITAPVKLPSREAMAVQLGPVNLVDRIEEYQADENLGHTLIGLFAGAALGILVNWFTTPDIEASRASVVLLVTFLVIAGGIGFWLWRVKGRKRQVKNEVDAL